MRRKCSIGLLLLAVLGSLTVTVAADSKPFTGYTPPGWVWWHSGDYSMLLPADAQRGEQTRFFLVTAGDQTNTWLPGWIGGGEITWTGPLQIQGGSWAGQVGTGQNRRVITGTNGQWTFVGLSFEWAWNDEANLFNQVLRGGL